MPTQQFVHEDAVVVTLAGADLPRPVAEAIADKGELARVITWDAGDGCQALAFRRRAKLERILFVVTPGADLLAELAWSAVMDAPGNVGIYVDRRCAGTFAELVSAARERGAKLWSEATTWPMAAWVTYEQ